jgi:WD40 repeat protein
VINQLPKTAGQTEKGVMVDIAKMIPLEQLLKMLSEGVSALYTNHRNDDALTRRTDPAGGRKMARIFRGQGRGVARALLLAFAFVAVASPSARAQLYEQPELIVDPGMHTAPIRDVGVDAAGRIAITGGLDKTLRIWSLTNGELLRTIRIPAGPGDIGKIYAVAVRPDGPLVAAGGWTQFSNSAREDSIYVFKTLTGQMAARIAGIPSSTASLAFSPDGRYLAAGLFGTNGLRVYDRDRQWSEVFRDTNYGDRIWGVTFSADGRLATTSYDGKVRLYDRDFRLVVPPEKVTGGRGPFKIAFSPDGALLAVGYNDVPNDLIDENVRAQMLKQSDGGVAHLETEYNDLFIDKHGSLPGAEQQAQGATRLHRVGHRSQRSRCHAGRTPKSMWWNSTPA